MSRDRRPLDDHPATSVIPNAAPPAGHWSRVVFPGEEGRAFAHEVLTTLAAAHPAGRLRIALRISPERRADWAWTGRLPHAPSPASDPRADAELAARPAFVPGARPTAEEPLIIVVLDSAGPGERLATTGVRNTIAFDLDDRRRRPSRTTLRLDVSGDGVRAVWTAPDRTERSVLLPDARAAAALVAPDTPHSAPPPHNAPRLPAASPTVDHLLPPLIPTRDRGLTTAAPLQDGPLMIPAGIVACPSDGLPCVLRVDLSGHLLITGSAGSGKSTLVTTLVIALALTRTPREAQVYCLDPGGALRPWQGLPHVGAVADDPETAGAVIAKLAARLGRPVGGEHTVLVIDGPEPTGHAAALGRLVADGPAHGVHLIVTSKHHRSFSGAKELDLDGTRPGHGTDRDAPFLAALPRLDGVESAENLDDAVSALVTEIAEHWGDRPEAPGVRALPANVPAAELPAPRHRLQAVIGLSDGELAPVAHDFTTAPHLIVIGKAGSGKTNLLRLFARAVTTGRSPVEARILVVDYRGGLLHTLPEEFVLGHAFSAGVLGELVDGTARAIGERREAADAGRAWQGPRLFILIDDHDPDDPAYGPLEPLIEYLPQGHALGAHLVVATAGEPVGPFPDGLRDAGAATLRLSGQPGRARYHAGDTTSLIQTALAD